MTSSYVDRIAAEIRRAAEHKALRNYEDLSLYRFYALLLLAKGRLVTEEDVHNAWSAWASEHDPTHRDLIPFNELSARTQRKDSQYVNAIRDLVDRI